MRNSALEYLAMDVNERINWRAENEITIKDWYEGLKPEPLEEGFLSATQFCELLGITYLFFRRLLERGVLEGTYTISAPPGKQWRIPSDTVNGLRFQEALLIKRSDLVRLLQAHGLISSEPHRFLNLRYEGLFFLTLEQSIHKIKLVDAARIIYDLRRNKRIAETYFSLEQLIDAIGSDRTRKSEHEYLLRKIAQGGIKAELISEVGSYARCWMLSPHEYHRVVREEKESLRLIEENFTVEEVAKIIGMSVSSLRKQVWKGRIPVITLERPIWQIKYLIPADVVAELSELNRQAIKLKEAKDRLKERGLPTSKFTEYLSKLPTETRFLGERVLLPGEFETLADLIYQNSDKRIKDEVQAGNIISFKEAERRLAAEGFPYYRLRKYLSRLDIGTKYMGWRLLTHLEFDQVAYQIYQKSRLRHQHEVEELTRQVQSMQLDDSILEQELADDIDEVPLEVERQLWILARAGNETAFERLAVLYQQSIQKMANSMFKEVPFKDKCHYGIIGLYNAITHISGFDGDVRRYARKTIKWTIFGHAKESLFSQQKSLDEIPEDDSPLYEIIASVKGFELF